VTGGLPPQLKDWGTLPDRPATPIVLNEADRPMATSINLLNDRCLIELLHLFFSTPFARPTLKECRRKESVSLSGAQDFLDHELTHKKGYRKSAGN